MEEIQNPSLFTALVLEIFRLNGVLLAEGDRLTLPSGLTAARWQVIGPLAERAATVPQIARHMGLTRQGVQRTINILQAEGLVTGENNPDHKRAKLFRLTEEGRNRFEEVMERQRHWAAAISAGLSPEELGATRRLLEELRGRLESLAQKSSGSGSDQEASLQNK